TVSQTLASTNEPIAPAPAWVVAADGRSFRAPGRHHVSLARRGALHRLLRALVKQRTKAPDVAIAPNLLVEVGWPNQKMHLESGLNRVRVAMSTLRKMGLRTLLLNRDDGYLLDPREPIELE